LNPWAAISSVAAKQARETAAGVFSLLHQLCCSLSCMGVSCVGDVDDLRTSTSIDPMRMLVLALCASRLRWHQHLLTEAEGKVPVGSIRAKG